MNYADAASMLTTMTIFRPMVARGNKGRNMRRNELDNALRRIKELWAELEVKPRPGTIAREASVKRAIVILQNIADQFDVRRA